MSNLNDIHDYQKRFWQEIVLLRVHLYYLQYFQFEAEKNERTLNIVLAIISNTSLAAWAISQHWQLLWAFLIGVSQIINATRPYLPFKKRSNVIIGMRRELDELALQAEYKWYKISEGENTNEEIHEEIINIKKRKSKIELTYIGSSPLPENEIFLKKAEFNAQKYFHTAYGIGDET